MTYDTLLLSSPRQLDLLRNGCFLTSSDAITGRGQISIIRLGLLQDVVPDHVIETTKPRFVGVAANVYAVGKFDSPGVHVLHVQIYVDDQKTNCLAPALDLVAPCPGIDLSQFFDRKLDSFRHNSSDAGGR
jgi:hypothetical protein